MQKMHKSHDHWMTKMEQDDDDEDNDDDDRVSRHFPYSRDFVVSCVFRQFLS